MRKKQVQIVNAARDLFFHHGIRRISIKEICEKAEVSKVTFYRYYNNKEELAVFIQDSLVEEGFSRFDEISEQEISYGEKIDLMTEWRRGFFSGMSADFIEDVFSMEGFNEMIRERFYKVITSAQDKGEIKKELSPELIWLVSEKMFELVTEGKWKEAVPEYSEYQAQMRLLFFHGLLTE